MALSGPINVELERKFCSPQLKRKRSSDCCFGFEVLNVCRQGAGEERKLLSM